MSIGAVLAAARRQAGMTIAQVSQQTRIREQIIGAIESDDFSGCGADFYARGHIRAIARAVGVDPGPLIEEYDSRVGAPPVSAAAAAVSTAAWGPGLSGADQPRRHPGRNWAVALVLVLAAVLGVIIYHAVGSTPARPAVAADHKPVAARHAAAHKHAAPTAVHRGPRRLVISVAAVSGPCWVDLTRRDGTTIFEGILGAGTSKTWRVLRAVHLRLGNPAAVTLRIDGKRHARFGLNPVTLRLAPGPSG